jgi:hypothetical protein
MDNSKTVFKDMFSAEVLTAMNKQNMLIDSLIKTNFKLEVCFICGEEVQIIGVWNIEEPSYSTKKVKLCSHKCYKRYHSMTKQERLLWGM